MKNIEIKLAADNFRKINPLLKNLGAKHEGTLEQVDTYFVVPRGRLKLRAINNSTYQLIFYSRPDKEKSKLSDYHIVEFSKEQYLLLLDMLKLAYGITVIVKKKRILWIYKNTRIHLDKVDSLGSFIELETVINTISLSDGKKEHADVIRLFRLGDYKKVNNSYSDLLSR